MKLIAIGKKSFEKRRCKKILLKRFTLKNFMMLLMKLCILFGLFSHLISQGNFPVNELYNMPPAMQVLASDQFCDGATSNQWCCDCEDSCLRFKTCCIDKLWNSTNPLPLQEYLEVLINETSKYKGTTCESVFPLVSGSQNMYMVSTCADGAVQEDIDGCLNINSLSYEYNIPVFGNDSFLYKNSFCARCNFIENFELVNLTADCRSNTKIPNGPSILVAVFGNETTTTSTTTIPPKTNLYEDLESCVFDIWRSDSLNSVILKYCTPRYNYERNIVCQRSNEYYKECLSYYGFVSAFGKEYANYHCYLCNATDADQAKTDTPDLTCEPETLPSKDILQWSFTLSFSSQTNVGVSGPGYSKSDNFCQDGEFYNIITSQCEIFSCSTGYQKVSNTCQRVKASKIVIVENPSFDRCLIVDNVSFIVELNTTLANTISLENEIENLLNISINSTFKRLFTSNNVSVLQSTINVTNTTLQNIQNVLIQPEITLWKTVNALFISVIPNNVANKLHGVDLKRAFPEGRLCVDPVVEVNPQGNFTETCSYQNNYTIIDYLDTSLFLTIQPGEAKRTVSVCSNYYLHSSCRLREISLNYTITKDLILFAENKYYNTSEYIPTEDGFSVCVEEIEQENGWYQSVLNAQKYISIVGTSLSIFSYVAMIIFYTFIKELKNTASMTIVALCATLLFADTVFIAATQLFNNKEACKVIAILLHWALLSAEGWTAVIAFDVLSKFGSVALASTKRNSKRFVQYCCLAYLLPSIIVTVTVILNETEVYGIGYGENNICFIYHFYPKLYFYIIPFAITFATTLTCFTATMFFISKHERKTKKVLKNSGRNKTNVVSIAFKLILSLGIIEIVGLIQISKMNLSESELIFNSVFALTYTVLRSLRGVILCFIYGRSTDNIKIFRQIIKNKKCKWTFTSTETQNYKATSTNETFL